MTRTILLLAIGLALACGRAAGGPLPDCVVHARWVEVRTRHFDLLTDTPEAEARGQALRLEWLAQTIERWEPALRDRSGRRVLAYGLAGAGCFEPFHMGREVDAAGYVWSSVLGRYLAYAAGFGARGAGIAPHEATHAILLDRMAGLPVCLHEGLAEYFSTFQAGAGLVEYGHPLPVREAALGAGPLMRLDQLFAMTYESRDFRPGPRRRSRSRTPRCGGRSSARTS